MDNSFTDTIKGILHKHFGENSTQIFDQSPLLQYIAIKTRSAQKGSKSRGSFANLYAIYVLVEDYLAQGYDAHGDYSSYEGAQFNRLFTRQRELPFGSKLQNHALNHRLNEEFKKFFPAIQYVPILRNTETNRYWLNDNLIKVELAGELVNLAKVVIEIIDAYVQVKRESFEQFIGDFQKLSELTAENAGDEIKEKLFALLEPNVDARIFEIVSFAILKTHYKDVVVYFGYDPDHIESDKLHLYKTGRTNANDGGIDFVMKPLGRFFQVTETLDVKKYFLDIDKIERYPITFVVKSEVSSDDITTQLRANATKSFPVKQIVDKYMASIEEIINIPQLKQFTDEIFSKGQIASVLEEVIVQSKVEFNYQEDAEVIEELVEAE